MLFFSALVILLLFPLFFLLLSHCVKNELAQILIVFIAAIIVSYSIFILNIHFPIYKSFDRFLLALIPVAIFDIVFGSLIIYKTLKYSALDIDLKKMDIVSEYSDKLSARCSKMYVLGMDSLDLTVLAKAFSNVSVKKNLEEFIDILQAKNVEPGIIANGKFYKTEDIFNIKERKQLLILPLKFHKTILLLYFNYQNINNFNLLKKELLESYYSYNLIYELPHLLDKISEAESALQNKKLKEITSLDIWPKTFPTQEGIKCAFLATADKISQPYFDFIPTGTGLAFVVLTDTQSINTLDDRLWKFYSLKKALFSGFISLSQPAVSLSALNNVAIRNMKIIALNGFIGFWNKESRSIEVSSAGMIQLYILRGKKDFQVIDLTGPFVGNNSIERQKYPSSPNIRLAAEDLLLISSVNSYSISEITGKNFEIKQIEKILLQNYNKTPSEILSLLKNEFKKALGNSMAYSLILFKGGE